MKIAVVGGGAAGLFVSGLLAEKGQEVTIFDKNEKLGKKLYITGKGRCNLTNLCEPAEFLKNVVRGEKFLRSAIYNFTPQDCVNFFEDLGLKTKVERGNRVFPESDKASDIIKALVNHCKNVQTNLNEEVLSVTKKNDQFLIVTKKDKYLFDKVIISTGGKSYSATGSDGFGYRIAQSFGHNIVPLRPALCPIKISDSFISMLQGLSLKNVQLNAIADGKKLSFFGEMLFTDCGITGPIVLTLSSFINRADKVELSLDFKPALTEKQLDLRILREFEENKNKALKNVMKNLLPSALIDCFIKACKIDEDKKVNEITKQERQTILNNLKNFKLTFGGLYDLETAVVTSGGVDLKEVDPKTFESKFEKGLYFLGEVLDADALTGGFNLQIAWSSAFSLAKNFDFQ